METEQPNCSLISLDNSQETIENDVSQNFEKQTINIDNEQQQKTANSCTPNDNCALQYSSASAALPDVNNSLISDDDNDVDDDVDEGNLADGSAAEYTNTEKFKNSNKNNNNSGSSTGKCNTSTTENEQDEGKKGVTPVVNVNGNATRKSSSNSLSRKQINRQTANSRNQKHDKVTSNISK